MANMREDLSASFVAHFLGLKYVSLECSRSETFDRQNS